MMNKIKTSGLVAAVSAISSPTQARVGDTVKKGQVIGKIGKTGRTTGPHLHWGVRWRDIDLDPKLLVPSK